MEGSSKSVSEYNGLTHESLVSRRRTWYSPFNLRPLQHNIFSYGIIGRTHLPFVLPTDD